MPTPYHFGKSHESLQKPSASPKSPPATHADMGNKKHNRKKPRASSALETPNPFQLYGYNVSPHIIDHFASQGVFPRQTRADGKFDWNAVLNASPQDLVRNNIMSESYLQWKATLPKATRLQPITVEEGERFFKQLAQLHNNGVVKSKEKTETQEHNNSKKTEEQKLRT